VTFNADPPYLPRKDLWRRWYQQ